MNQIFGPVPSRRLGFSLGIDPIPFKTCSLNCIYCQLGKTTFKTIKRKEYIPVRKILNELKEVLTSPKEIDYITLSGSGEPTLNSKTGKLIKEIKNLTDIPVAVLTNGTLLTKKELRQELLPADVVIPSLDAGNQETFIKINRPHPSLKIEKIIEGMMKFRDIYKGEIWLEVMLVKDINDSEEELNSLRNVIEIIRPNRIQLNTPVRPPSEKWVKILTNERLLEIKEFFGENCEVIAEFKRKEQKAYIKDIEDEILTLISRRPVTTEEISFSLGLHINEVIKYVESLLKQKKVISKIYHEKRYLTKEGQR